MRIRHDKDEHEILNSRLNYVEKKSQQFHTIFNLSFKIGVFSELVIPVLMSSPLSPFQGKPVEILPFLFLGSAYHASREDYLSDLHITALLNVSRRDLQPAKGQCDYKWIPVEDSPMADISSHFQEAIEFIGESK